MDWSTRVTSLNRKIKTVILNQIRFIGLRSGKDYYKRPSGVYKRPSITKSFDRGQKVYQIEIMTLTIYTVRFCLVTGPFTSSCNSSFLVHGWRKHNNQCGIKLVHPFQLGKLCAWSFDCNKYVYACSACFRELYIDAGPTSIPNNYDSLFNDSPF